MHSILTREKWIKITVKRDRKWIWNCRPMFSGTAKGIGCNIEQWKKRSDRREHYSKAEPKIFAPPADPLPGGVGRPKFRDGHHLYLQTQFGEDRCTQFRVIEDNRPIHTQTHTTTHPPTDRQDRLQYTAPQLARSVPVGLIQGVAKPTTLKT